MITNKEDGQLKRTLISALVMALLVGNTIGVQAATTDTTDTNNTSVTTTANTTKVSLDNIKEIMLENNLNMKTAYNTMKIAGEKYKQERDIVDELSDDEKETTTGAAVVAELDTLRTNLKTANVTYNKNVAAYINTAQSDYVSYLEAVSNRETEENAVKVQERKTQMYKLQYDNGFLSKNDYNKYLQENTTENYSLDKLKNAEELAKLTLCNDLGISSEDNVTVSTDIKDDLDKVSQINYDTDLNTVLSNNYSIQSATITLDELKDQEDEGNNNDGSYGENVYNYTLKNDEYALTQAINTATSGFKQQYNSLMNSYNTMKSDYDALNTEKTDYNTVQLEYNYGFLSKDDMEDAQIGTSGLDKANSDYENAKNTFYANYLRYLQMKEGY
jgi:hypothetical protein